MTVVRLARARRGPETRLDLGVPVQVESKSTTAGWQHPPEDDWLRTPLGAPLRIGRTELAMRALVRQIVRTAEATGLSYSEIHDELAELYSADGSSRVLAAHALLERARTQPPRADECAIVLPARPAVQAAVSAVGPLVALWAFLEWLIQIGRRADVSRQLAVERLQLLFRAARSSPDVPPGEVVVSSACVPRGPSVSRMDLALLSSIRGDQLSPV